MNRAPPRIRTPYSWRKRVVFSLLPGLTLLFLCIAAGEIGLRLRYRHIERLTGASPWKTGRWKELTYFWDQFHPNYGWTNLPGFQSNEDVPFQVTINGQGLRGRQEADPQPREGVRRIAVFGDSCTFGEEVDDDQTLPFFMERFLSDAEVLNFGVRGFGLGQMMLRLEDSGFEFHPDHVVFVLLLPSDLARDAVAQFSHPKPAFQVQDGELVIRNHPVTEASRQPWILRHSFAAAWLWGRPKEPGADQADDWDAILATTEHLLRRIQGACQEQDVGFTVVLMATAGTLQRMQTNQTEMQHISRLRRFLAAQDVDVLDRVGFLGKTWNELGAPLVAPHGHWSARGNCLLAEQIAQHLSARIPELSLAADPPRCK